MALKPYAHPFSSYCQKVLIALWENDIPFVYRHLEEEGVTAERLAIWPLGRFPVLVDDGQTIAESSIIIEYLDLHYRGTTLFLPDDRATALEVRFLDRFFDHYVMSAMQQPVFEALRENADRKEEVLERSRQALTMAYTFLNQRLAGRKWAAGDHFTMADCAAAPSLFYADWVHEIDPQFDILRDYRLRLLERPSFARAVEEARPYRGYFPLGAPDRD